MASAIFDKIYLGLYAREYDTLALANQLSLEYEFKSRVDLMKFTRSVVDTGEEFHSFIDQIHKRNQSQHAFRRKLEGKPVSLTIAQLIKKLASKKS